MDETQILAEAYGAETCVEASPDGLAGDDDTPRADLVCDGVPPMPLRMGARRTTGCALWRACTLYCRARRPAATAPALWRTQSLFPRARGVRRRLPAACSLGAPA
jgi:hypothetical protein